MGWIYDISWERWLTNDNESRLHVQNMYLRKANTTKKEPFQQIGFYFIFTLKLFTGISLFLYSLFYGSITETEVRYKVGLTFSWLKKKKLTVIDVWVKRVKEDEREKKENESVWVIDNTCTSLISLCTFFCLPLSFFSLSHIIQTRYFTLFFP